MSTVLGRALAVKLATIMAEMQHIEKKGHNAFHKYDYVRAEDLEEVIRQKLIAHRLVFTCGVEAPPTHQPIGDRGHLLTTVVLRVTLDDLDSDESMTRLVAGTGSDGGDKGLYKAITGGLKYFWRSTFLVPIGSDDPEADTSVDKAASGPRAQAPRPPATAAKPKAAPPNGQTVSGCLVSSVESLKTGDNKFGAWELVKVTFEDGTEATTLSPDIIALARSLEGTERTATRAIETGTNKRGYDETRLTFLDPEPEDDTPF